jgi:hypothetical protein
MEYPEFYLIEELWMQHINEKERADIKELDNFWKEYIEENPGRKNEYTTYIMKRKQAYYGYQRETNWTEAAIKRWKTPYEVSEQPAEEPADEVNEHWEESENEEIVEENERSILEQIMEQVQGVSLNCARVTRNNEQQTNHNNMIINEAPSNNFGANVVDSSPSPHFLLSDQAVEQPSRVINYISMKTTETFDFQSIKKQIPEWCKLSQAEKILIPNMNNYFGMILDHPKQTTVIATKMFNQEHKIKYVKELSTTQFSIMYNQSLPVTISENGKEKMKKMSCAHIFLNSELRRNYDRIIYDPRYIQHPTVDKQHPTHNLLNKYSGMKYTDEECRIAYEDNIEKLRWFREYYVKKIICWDNTEMYCYVESYFAKIYKYPSRKSGKMLILVGPQGCGKSVFGKMMLIPFGVNGASTNTTSDVTGQFNNRIECLQFFFLDEFYMDKNYEKRARLLATITEHNIRLEKKFEGATEIPSYINFIAATDREETILLDETYNRRFVIVPVNPLYSNNENSDQFFTKLSALIEEDDNALVKAYYYYLFHFAPELNEKKVPLSDRQIALQGRQLKSFGQWLQEILTQGCHVYPSDLLDCNYNLSNEIVCKGGRLQRENDNWVQEIADEEFFECYAEWCLSNSLEREFNNKDLVERVKKVFPEAIGHVEPKQGVRHKKHRERIRHLFTLTNHFKKRRNYIRLPSLENARKAFEKHYNVLLDIDEIEETQGSVVMDNNNTNEPTNGFSDNNDNNLLVNNSSIGENMISQSLDNMEDEEYSANAPSVVINSGNSLTKKRAAANSSNTEISKRHKKQNEASQQGNLLTNLENHSLIDKELQELVGAQVTDNESINKLTEKPPTTAEQLFQQFGQEKFFSIVQQLLDQEGSVSLVSENSK